jgi:hypothetical protein
MSVSWRFCWAYSRPDSTQAAAEKIEQMAMQPSALAKTKVIG